MIDKLCVVYVKTFQCSLFNVSSSDVLLWAVKPADDGSGQGIVARLWNVADRPATARFTLSSGAVSAHRVTHLETDLAPVALRANAVTAEFAPQQLQTFRLMPHSSSAR